MQSADFGQAVGVQLSRHGQEYAGMVHTPKFAGKFKAEHWRDGKKIGEYDIPNGITNIGKDTALNILFGPTAKISTWYIGLISLASYSALAAADTMSSHAGWVEFTGYSESVRQTWGAGSAASQSITNASVATFTINATGTVKGIFIPSDSTKSGTTGTLWSTALFGSDVAVLSGDLIKITYTVTAA